MHIPKFESHSNETCKRKMTPLIGKETEAQKSGRELTLNSGVIGCTLALGFLVGKVSGPSQIRRGNSRRGPSAVPSKFVRDIISLCVC